jgi:2-polyprenyl-3-methyl-5-hydroxy-6-metoxy-1,4-benzoquinol methylase
MIPDTFNVPTVRAMGQALIALAPEQEKVLVRRFGNVSSGEAQLLEDIAQRIVAIAGNGLTTMFSDYVWLCGMLLEEEIYFRRYGRYRYSTFVEANANVYSDDHFMERYMNGLLMSQLWWSNHTDMIGFYRDHYLNCLPDGASHLEVGPGHGLLLAYACSCSRVKQACAWDLSPTSIRHTEEALKRMGTARMPQLQIANLFDASDDTFDSLVLSEVLEHTEAPEAALQAIRKLLKPGGFLFLNMPINSPAPDHLFNLPAPEDVIDFLKQAGFDILDHRFAPVTNATLERARRMKLTISCGVVARRVV